jgi:DNA repair exonuclease SbcCD ATPase subunit
MLNSSSTKTLDDMIQWASDKSAQLSLLERQQADRVALLDQKQKRVEQLTKARWVISEVARQTQERFKEYVEPLVTKAIQSAWEDRDLKFVLEFKISHNKSEAYLMVQEGDNPPYVPEDDMGGSILDIIGIAMRIVLSSLSRPKVRSVIILDEPMKFVGKGAVLMKTANILKEISHRLGFQLILVTHEPALAQIADKAWEVRHNRIYSEVSLIKDEEPESAPPPPTTRRRRLE